MIAYIPARIGSKRIPKKNIRPLGGIPVIEHVVRQLQNIVNLTGIAVSTDSEEVIEIVGKLPLVTVLDKRDAKLSTDTATFMDLVEHDIPRFAKHFNDPDVLIATATSALIQSSLYQEAITLFEKNNRTGLVISVSPYATSPYLALIEEKNNLRPLFLQEYLKPTSQLPRTGHDSGCFYVINIDHFEKQKKEGLRSFFDLKPSNAVWVDPEVGIDLDNETDWNRLEEAYRQSIMAKGKP